MYWPVHVNKSWWVIPWLCIKHTVVIVMKISTVKPKVFQMINSCYRKVLLFKGYRQYDATHPPYRGKKFERLHGKWYPLWASTVSKTLNTIHSHSVKRWGPVRAGPTIVANPRNKISAGWAYSEVRPKGVAYLRKNIISNNFIMNFYKSHTYSWCTLWICLYSHLVCSNLCPQ